MDVNNRWGEKWLTDYHCNLGKIRLLPPHQASLVTLAGYYTADRDVIRPETDKTKSVSPPTHLRYRSRTQVVRDTLRYFRQRNMVCVVV